MKTNRIQKILTTLGLLVIVVLFAGCPYSSIVPIDEGTIKVPLKLAGEWIGSADVQSENPTYIAITIEDEFHAQAQKMEYSSSDSAYSATTYTLTFSDVKGETFMNVIEDGGDSYSLYKFGFDENTGEVNTSEVTDYIKETFSTSEELKDFILKNKSNSYFFTNTNENYVRK